MLFSSLWHQISFNRIEKGRFLRIMQAQVKAGISWGDMFYNMQKNGQTSPTKQLAILALEGYERYGSYITNWRGQGYWNEVEMELLVSAEQTGMLEEIASIIEGISAPQRSFFTAVLVPCAQWIISALLMMGILLGSLTQEDLLQRIGGGDIATLRYAHLLADWGPLVALIIALFCVAYLAARRFITMPLRGQLRKAGGFSLYDRQFGATMARLLAVFLEQGFAPAESLCKSGAIYLSHPAKTDMINQAIREIDAGIKMSDSLKDILRPEQSELLQMLAPNEDSVSLARSLRGIANILDEAIDQIMATTRTSIQIISLIIFGGLTFILMELLTGSFMQP